MPKYKDSPEVRAAKKERKEKFREFLSMLDIEDMSDLRSAFKEKVLENGLEAELDEELGYTKYDYRNKDTATIIENIEHIRSAIFFFDSTNANNVT